MATRRSRPTGPTAGPAPRRRRATNLSLDPELVAAAERYGARHGKSVSHLVNDFLAGLAALERPLDAELLTPAVRRLYGAAAGPPDAPAPTSEEVRADYREYLARKYGAADGR